MKINHVILTVLALIALIGCGANQGDAKYPNDPCQDRSGARRVFCLEILLAIEKGKKPGIDDPPANAEGGNADGRESPAPPRQALPSQVDLKTSDDPPAPQPAARVTLGRAVRPAPRTMPVLESTGEVCRYGYDLVVENDRHSGEPYIEVVADNLGVCNGYGLVSTVVKPPVGRSRNAVLIPMGSKGHFFKASGGENGYDYRVVGYDAPWPDPTIGMMVAATNGRMWEDRVERPSRGENGRWTRTIRRGMLSK